MMHTCAFALAASVARPPVPHKYSFAAISVCFQVPRYTCGNNGPVQVWGGELLLEAAAGIEIMQNAQTGWHLSR